MSDASSRTTLLRRPSLRAQRSNLVLPVRHCERCEAILFPLFVFASAAKQSPATKPSPTDRHVALLLAMTSPGLLAMTSFSAGHFD
jgi:hypothetical protein